MAYDKVKTESYANLGGINQKNSEYFTGENEFLDLTNYDFRKPGAVSSRDGTTLYVGTTVVGRITGLYEFTRLDGASYQIATANTNAFVKVGSALNVFRTGLQNAAIFDFVSFVDHLFAANGTDFFKYNGVSAFPYGLPQPPNAPTVTADSGGTLDDGVYTVSYGYLSYRGFFGPPSAQATLTLGGGNNSITYSGLTTISGFGITALVFYLTNPDGVDQFAGGFASGVTTFTISAASLGIAIPDISSFTLVPKYLELYQNRLFMAGFSSLPSNFYFSELAEPEGVDPANFIEVRTNDGDRITALKAYQNSLIVFKDRSFHRLTGDSEESFSLAELSDQYGCVSNRATATYDDFLVFLDRSGVMRFNGANIETISDRIEPIIQSMNIPAARENAVAIHNRERREIWFAIPCNGATFNNRIIVYDYLVNAWTKHEGVNPSSLSYFFGGLDSQAPFTGSYSGSIAYFHPDVKNDLGSGITYLTKSRFYAPGGNTTTQLFRRYYLDVDPIVGLTGNIEVSFFTDHSTSASLLRVMGQAPFQSRIDFGLPAKSMAAQSVVVGTTTGIVINGWTIETRYLRST